MKLISADKLCAILVDWQLCEIPEENVNYKSGRMVTDHERQYEVYLMLEEVIKEVADQEYVKAIPIEWILKWACEFVNPNSEGYKMAMELVHDWEKENEDV